MTRRNAALRLASGTLLSGWRDGESLPWPKDWEDGHYVVLAGMDKRNIFVMDPVVHSGYGYIPKKEFMDRWHDYDTHNEVRTHHHLAVFINGSKRLSRFPASAIKVN
jgi:hypothetical protein